MNKESPPAPALQADPPAASAILVSDRLTRMIDEAEADLALASRDRPLRGDGWTPERVRIFLETLADCGLVGLAASAAGMSRTSAYAFRRRAQGRPFCIAWKGAQLLARQRLADDVLERAIKGCFEIVLRDGKIVAERHRHDNRFTLAVLERLDRQARAGDEEAHARLAAQEFEEYVGIVCAGGQGAADFVEARSDAPIKGERGLLARLTDYLFRTGMAE